MAKENYVKLYRGLQNTTSDDLSTGRDDTGYHESTGIHWTPDFDIAKNFAQTSDYAGPGEGARSTGAGLVLEAMVHKRHLIDYNSEEGQHYASRYHIEEPDPESTENETTVRRGAPVLITRKHLVGKQFKTEEPDMPIRARA